MPSNHAVPVVLVALAFTLATGLAGAQSEAGGASGTFESSGAKLTVTDAYAFRGTSSLGEAGALIVAVSNAGFQPAVIDRYFDRRYVLEHFFKDEQTGLVYFEFDADGRYRGLSYYFGPGDGCGYCSGGVESTVRRAGERLSGKLKQVERSDADAGRQFEIEIDVAIASDDHGNAAGTGGGAPGGAYLAYHVALAGDDGEAIRGLLSAERRETWAGATANGDSAGFLAFLRQEHPVSARVTEAFVRDTQALVLFDGENADGRIRGEAFLVLEEGAWRFEEETLQPVYD